MVKRVCILFSVTFFVFFSSYARDIRDELELLGKLADIDARYAVNLTTDTESGVVQTASLSE
jgi:hypothetical protein